MFTVLETNLLPSRRGRSGHRVTVRDTPRYISVALDLPLRARDKAVRVQAGRGLLKAFKMGSAEVVLPKGFPFPELPGRYGFAVCGPAPLLRGLAPELCCYAVEESGVPWKNVRVSLAGRRSTQELLNAAQRLSALVRSLHIEAGGDTGAVCYLLRRRCGISVVGRPARPEAGILDIRILFERPAARPPALPPPDGTLVLDLTGGVCAETGGRVADGALLEPPRRLWKNRPAGCDDGALLAALWAEGQITLKDVGIRGLTRGGETFQFFP
ncbi:MAG: hypothetical protein FWG72_03490 [Oscillospiraceae bacterium]|nr:hypothetical protein [Oscillospiraceae bacterium]